MAKEAAQKRQDSPAANLSEQVKQQAREATQGIRFQVQGMEEASSQPSPVPNQARKDPRDQHAPPAVGLSPESRTSVANSMRPNQFAYSPPALQAQLSQPANQFAAPRPEPLQDRTREPERERD